MVLLANKEGKFEPNGKVIKAFCYSQGVFASYIRYYSLCNNSTSLQGQIRNSLFALITCYVKFRYYTHP